MDIEQVNKLYLEYTDRVNKDQLKDQPWIIIDRLADIILNYVHGCVVEIGIGFSTVILNKHAEKAGVPFYTCDSKEARCDWARTTFPNAKVFFGRSSAFMKQFQDNPALVFIDGEHNFRTMYNDSKFFLDRMLTGGIMFLHDTCPVEFRFEKIALSGKALDCHKIRKYLETQKDFDVFTWRYTAAECGLTMVLKKELNAPEYKI